MSRSRLTYAERIRNIRRRFYAEIVDGIALLIILAGGIYLLLEKAGELVVAAAIQMIRWTRP